MCLFLQHKTVFQLQQRNQLPYGTISSQHTYLGQRLSAPLPNPLGDADDTLHSFVQCLLYVFQGRDHGDVGDSQSDVGPENGHAVQLHQGRTSTV